MNRNAGKHTEAGRGAIEGLFLWNMNAAWVRVETRKYWVIKRSKKLGRSKAWEEEQW